MVLVGTGFNLVSSVASIISLKPRLLTTRASCKQNGDLSQLAILSKVLYRHNRGNLYYMYFDRYLSIQRTLIFSGKKSQVNKICRYIFI